MNKKNHVKTQSTLAVFALSLVSLNAAEQKQVYSPADVHQTPVVELQPAAKYESFIINTDKGKGRWSQEMRKGDKPRVVAAFPNVCPDLFADFIDSVHQPLSQESQRINESDKARVIDAVCRPSLSRP
ncbi:MAG: hypothetical protein NEHIOOID_00976 [Holosporales bacterium]